MSSLTSTMAAASNRTSSQELTPENQLPDKEQSETQGSSGKRQKSRHRASVACASCRDRRIRVCHCSATCLDDVADSDSVSYLQESQNVRNASVLE